MVSNGGKGIKWGDARTDQFQPEHQVIGSEGLSTGWVELLSAKGKVSLGGGGESRLLSPASKGSPIRDMPTSVWPSLGHHPTSLIWWYPERFPSLSEEEQQRNTHPKSTSPNGRVFKSRPNREMDGVRGPS